MTAAELIRTVLAARGSALEEPRGKLGALVPVSGQSLQGLKFAQCLPAWLAERMLKSRLADTRGARLALSEPVRPVGVAR